MTSAPLVALEAAEPVAPGYTLRFTPIAVIEANLGGRVPRRIGRDRCPVGFGSGRLRRFGPSPMLHARFGYASRLDTYGEHTKNRMRTVQGEGVAG